MRSPIAVLREAEIARISALTAWGDRVFGSHPEQEDFPYILSGNVRFLDWSDKFKPGQQVFSTYDFWDPSESTVNEMMDDVLQAITSSPLQLEGEFRAVMSRLDLFQILKDIDGRTNHGVLTFKYLIEEV